MSQIPVTKVQQKGAAATQLVAAVKGMAERIRSRDYELS